MAIGPTLPSHLAGLVVKRLRDFGVATDPVLKEVGLGRGQIANRDDRIPFYKTAALIEVAARELGDPSFGLKFGKGGTVQAIEQFKSIFLSLWGAIFLASYPNAV